MMRTRSVLPFLALLLVLSQWTFVESFRASSHAIASSSPLIRPQQQRRPLLASTSVTASGDDKSTAINGINGINGSATATQHDKDAQLKRLYRAQAGPFMFRTKYGVLNPFAIWYGSVSILLGLPWFVALTFYQFFDFVTRRKLDPQRKISNMLNQLWGVLLLRFTRSYPKIEGAEILEQFFKDGKPGMFVANHNSWMDIPFLGSTIGWRNYKIISKQELGKVPILGKAIKVGGHIMVDRKDKRSGLRALKGGIQYLKDGVHLCTFPEGTRSRSGRLMKFKNGAFKMAHKAGAPVVPLSIVGAQVAHPVWAMFPIKASHPICKIVVHEPIESIGKTEDELVEAVRNQMIAGLPNDQKPLEKKKDD